MAQIPVAYDYDVVIVGTGVAGALVADRLTRAGAKVLMLDAGPRPKEEDERRALVENFKKSPSKNQTSPYDPLFPKNQLPFQPDADFMSKGRNYYVEDTSPPAGKNDLFASYYEKLVGGTTWHWQGINIRMLPNDFKLESKFGRGFDWPIEYKDVEPWYSEAEEEMGVAGDHEALNNLHGAYRSKPFPMPEIPPSYLDKKVAAALKGQTFDGIPLRVTTVPQARNSVDGFDGRKQCDGHASCIPLCPIKAKYEAIFHVDKAIRGGTQLIENALVMRLEIDDNGLISNVVYLLPDGTGKSVTGRIVILAANAIETPKLLLLSNKQRPAGLANSSGLVGHYLMDHPIKMSYALVQESIFPFRGPPSTSSIETLRDGGFRSQRGAFRTTLRNDGWSWPTGAPRGSTLDGMGSVLNLVGKLRFFGEDLKRALAEHVHRQLVLNSAVEMLPVYENRVTLSTFRVDGRGIPRPEIHFKVDQYAIDAFAGAVRLHAQIFRAMNAIEWNLQDDGQMDSGSGHIMGTTMMGEKAESSVVDRDCRSHDHKNLFILGSSAFPTGATANPTLTIAALALRAAKTIKEQLAGGTLRATSTSPYSKPSQKISN